MSRIVQRRTRDIAEKNAHAMEKTLSMKIDDIRKMCVFDIIDHVIRLTEDQEFVIKGSLDKCLRVLSEKLNINPIQALFLSIFINLSADNYIVFKDLAEHFRNCRVLDIIKFIDDIEGMVNRGIIVQNRSKNTMSYYIPQRTLMSLNKNTLPQGCRVGSSATAIDWIKSIDSLLDQVREYDLTDDEFEAYINDNFKNNHHLECVQKIRALKLSLDDLKVFLCMSLSCIVEDEDHVERHDVRSLFDKYDSRRIINRLEAGDHPLMENNLIEHACEEGQANPKHWCLTDYSKSEIFGEFELSAPKVSTGLKQPETIVEKALYYDDSVNSQIARLQDMLKPERMNRILDRFSEQGMRKGFACLFYGGPGTGKTETVLQLARATGRSIMQIDISTIRDKWVGETEKRIKACFDRYRKYVLKGEAAPILFFNEADALFTKRTAQAEHSVDKMENAMQNIILQEMENLEGILIATTNLTDSLDPAFERRFLFKIEFSTPSASARRHIWQAMIPGLSDSDALMLANRFDFSGGQIENIARKHIIDAMLNDRDGIDMEAMLDSCRHESISRHKNGCKIGFVD